MIAKWQNISYLRILCYIFVTNLLFYLPFKLFIITHSSLTTLVIKFAQYFTTIYHSLEASIVSHLPSLSLSPSHLFCPLFASPFLFILPLPFFYLHDGIFFCFSDIIDYTFLLFFHSMNISWAFLSLIYVVFFIIFYLQCCLFEHTTNDSKLPSLFFFFFIKHIFPSFFLL